MIKQISALGLLAVLAAPLAGTVFAQDAMQKPDGTGRSSMSHDATRPNAMSGEAMKHPDRMAHGAMRKDSMGKEASPGGSMASDKMAPH